MNKPDFASMPPIEIGHLLAMSLDTSCAISDISDQEQMLLKTAKISINDYHRELLAFAGFAQDYAIVVALGNSAVGKQVRKGYLEVWEHMGRSSPYGADVYQTFISRCPEYARAATRNPDTYTFDPLATAFGVFLSPTSGTAEDGIAQALALTYSPIYFRTHFDIASDIILEAGLNATT